MHTVVRYLNDVSMSQHAQQLQTIVSSKTGLDDDNSEGSGTNVAVILPAHMTGEGMGDCMCCLAQAILK